MSILVRARAGFSSSAHTLSEAGWRARRLSRRNFIVSPVSMMSSTTTTCLPAIGLVTSEVMRTSPVVSVPPWYEDTPSISTVSGRSMARARSVTKKTEPLSTPSRVRSLPR